MHVFIAGTRHKLAHTKTEVPEGVVVSWYQTVKGSFKLQFINTFHDSQKQEGLSVADQTPARFPK